MRKKHSCGVNGWMECGMPEYRALIDRQLITNTCIFQEADSFTEGGNALIILSL